MMTDYKTLYLQLFNRVSGIITDLQQAQQEVEELYLRQDSAEQEEERLGKEKGHIHKPAP